MSRSYLSILRIVLHGRASGRILLASILSFTFSICVILCTFGLMDGFDYLLKTGLRHSSGDILITHKQGFFHSREVERALSANTVGTKVIQTEAFAIFEGKSRGVLVRGVDPESFTRVTGIDVGQVAQGIVLGSELAKSLEVSVGQEVALTMGTGNDSSEMLPSVKAFVVKGIVSHGIYQKDSRFLYIDRKLLSEFVGVGEKINLFLVGLPKLDPKNPELGIVSREVHDLGSALESEFRIKPYWDEYDFLIEAVEVEKLSISLILQLIVVVAVFNIVAFVIYVMEKKSQDFFFLRAVGLSLKELMRFWFISVIIVWSVSCVGAYLLSHVFNWSLAHLSIFQIPGEIYVLSKLQLRLNPLAHVTVYSVSLLWILGAAAVGYLRIRNRPIIQGLRQEFS